MNRFSKHYLSSFEEIRDPLLIVDTDGLIRASNAAAHATLEFDDGGPIGDLKWLDRRVVIDGESLRAIAAGSASTSGLRLKDSTGNDAQIVVDAIALGRKAGSRHTLLHFKDYSPYEKYEHWKDELVSMAAHEIKNPLSAMRNSITILVSQAAAGLSNEQRNLLEVSLRSIDRLTRLLDNLLDVSRISSGSYTPEPRWVDARDLTAEVVGTFKTLFNTRRQMIDYSVSESIGRIYVDAPKLEQILINLMNNAIKFTPEGGEVTVSVEPASLEVLGDDFRILPWSDLTPVSFVRFSVKDTGIGMTGETISHLFTRYHREYDPGRAVGSHLGLSISKTLAEVQNGTLECVSELGVGTRVSVALPADDRSFALVGRVRSMDRVLSRLGALHRDADVYVLRKGSPQPWNDVWEAWMHRPIVDPSLDDEKSGACYAWTLDETVAIALAVENAATRGIGPTASGATPECVERARAAGVTVARHRLSPQDLKVAKVFALALRERDERPLVRSEVL